MFEPVDPSPAAPSGPALDLSQCQACHCYAADVRHGLCGDCARDLFAADECVLDGDLDGVAVCLTHGTACAEVER